MGVFDHAEEVRSNLAIAPHPSQSIGMSSLVWLSASASLGILYLYKRF